jgi:hypothetical protein
MKNLLYILITALLLTGCSTRRLITSSVVSSRDSSVVKTALVAVNNTSSITITEKKDTTIGISEKKVEKSFTANDLKPLYDDKGNAVSHTKTFEGDGRNKGVKGNLTINADGSAKVECTADSLSLVIQGLVSTNTFQREENDSLRLLYASFHQSDSSDVSTSKTKGNVPGWLLWVVLAAGGVTGWFLKKILS